MNLNETGLREATDEREIKDFPKLAPPTSFVPRRSAKMKRIDTICLRQAL